MNLGEVSEIVEEVADGGPGRAAGESNGGAGVVSRALESGALAGVGGGLLLLRGVRALRRGRRGRGAVQLLLGAALVAAAAKQRRGGGVDQTDVVDTAPNIDDVSGGTGDDEHATGDEAEAVVDTSPDVEDAGPGTELDSDVESGDVDQTDVVETGVDEEEVQAAVQRVDEESGS